MRIWSGMPRLFASLVWPLALNFEYGIFRVSEPGLCIERQVVSNGKCCGFPTNWVVRLIPSRASDLLTRLSSSSMWSLSSCGLCCNSTYSVQSDSQVRGCCERHLAIRLSTLGYRVRPIMARWSNQTRTVASIVDHTSTKANPRVNVAEPLHAGAFPPRIRTKSRSAQRISGADRFGQR
jgi:hypothetical protein